VTVGSLLRISLYFGDGVSSEGDSCLGVERRAFVEHSGHFSHSHDELIYFNGSNDAVSVQFSQFSQLFSLFGDNLVPEKFLDLGEVAPSEEFTQA
jgi:hypothetical protein